MNWDGFNRRINIYLVLASATFASLFCVVFVLRFIASSSSFDAEHNITMFDCFNVNAENVDFSFLPNFSARINCQSPPLAMAQQAAIIQPMNAVFERLFATENTVPFSEWEKALPTKLERHQMRKLIVFLFGLNDFSPISSNPSLFLQRFVPTLAKSVQLTFIGDMFCVIHEHFPPAAQSNSSRFPRFWGYTVLTSRVHALRPHLHHSAPHFESDGNVCNQSAAIFERTLSRSLVISGASRFAVCGNVSSPCQSHFAVADGAHNDRTMFHVMCTALLDADGSDGTFVQWHGMAPTSCGGASAFLSAGVRHGHPIYSKPGATLNKLVATVNSLRKEIVAVTPDDEPKCPLVASTNIFGRMVNGVPMGKACNTTAQTKNVRGRFIHIEQKSELCNDWATWTTAVNMVFHPKEKKKSEEKLRN